MIYEINSSIQLSISSRIKRNENIVTVPVAPMAGGSDFWKCKSKKQSMTKKQ